MSANDNLAPLKLIKVTLKYSSKIQYDCIFGFDVRVRESHGSARECLTRLNRGRRFEGEGMMSLKPRKLN